MESIRYNQIKNALMSAGIEIEECTEDWENELEKTPKGNIKPTYKNHVLIFENADGFKESTIKYNEFERVIEFNDEKLNNTTTAKLRNAFERIGGFRNKEITRDFLFEYSFEHKYNPIKNYLEHLEWDGVKRVEEMFIDWFNVEDTTINRKLSEKWLVSGVKRIYEPGCPIEGMVILIGEQGLRQKHLH